MPQLVLWCISSSLLVFAVTALVLALLRAGRGQHYHNRYTAELMWQAQNPNTDWWLDIGRARPPDQTD